MAQPIKMSKANYEKLLRAERDFHDLLPEFDKMESCGIDCAPLREGVANYLEQMSNLKKNFAPNATQTY